ncbi:MAG: TIM44-like domain-containing protein, partial [Stellaceae bacterium]
MVLALVCCLGLVLAPVLAEARAGHSFGNHPSSMGSRGSRSWSGTAAPSAQPYGGHGSGHRGSFLQRHPFLTGIGGGLFGSWLFGHGWGGGSAIGGLFRLILLGLVIWFFVRLIRGRRFSGGRALGPTAFRSGVAPAPSDRGRDVNLADADLGAFERLHVAVQDAWSAADLGRLRGLMTPQMLDSFDDELSRNSSQGVQNIVTDIRLLNGELTEAWEEGDRQYATALLRWRAIDYVARL